MASDAPRAGLVGIFDRRLGAEHLHARSIDGFLRDARSQGAGRWWISRLHGDVVGAFDVGVFAEGLPWPAAQVVKVARIPALASVISFTLRFMVKACGRLRATRLEIALLRLTRRVEQQTGARLAARPGPSEALHWGN